MNLALTTDTLIPCPGIQIYTSIENTNYGKFSHLHTHGLTKHSQPEILWKNIPTLFTVTAANILNQIIKWYLVNKIKISTRRPLRLYTSSKETIQLFGRRAIGCRGIPSIELYQQA